MSKCFVKLVEYSPGKFYPEDTQYNLQTNINGVLSIVDITENMVPPEGHTLMDVSARDLLQNLNFQEWLEYVATKNKKVPDEVTPRQIRQALILKGVTLDQITVILDSLPEPQKSLAKVEWEYSTLVFRGNPMVSQVGLALGWTKEQLDDLFIFAKNL